VSAPSEMSPLPPRNVRPLALRAAIADALVSLTERVAAAEVARWLGVATSTVTRREGRLDACPASDLLTLVENDAHLADALRAFLDGTLRKGDPTAVERDASADIGRSAAEIAADNAALADGKVDRAECFARRARLTQHRDQIDAELANIDARLARGA
jgi:hypothetical protein